ncbi:hypothetical protein LTR69_011273 [Exophiala sideris]|uniref:Uncharacterized protein n=1 Tax=Exophiala sideris TaxID=1016849 RepID=A0ABR0IUN5_9EURO|nr:hypothetical protein LTR69_011273 [Exophiala sideris]
MTIEVYADELLRLSVNDIGDEITKLMNIWLIYGLDWLFTLVTLNVELMTGLFAFRKLVDLRAEKDQFRAVDADKLGDRLGRLPSREPTPSSRSSFYSATPVIDEEEERNECWHVEQESYRALVADGGRPSHPISLGFDVIDNPGEYDEYKDILWFWHSHGNTFHCEFHNQLITWRHFREFQDRMRQFYVSRNRFNEYEDVIRESLADLGCTWDLQVLEDRHQQNRLEDWNEFRAFYYRRLKAYEKRVPLAEQELLFYQEKFEDAQARLTDVISDPQVLRSRIGDIVASRRAITAANLRAESAQKEIEAAKRDNSKRKAVLTKKAQQKLRFAKDNMEHVSGSEEMRRLRDGSELQCAEEVLVRAKAELIAAQLEAKRWNVFVKWIDDQFPPIAAECGFETNDSVNYMLREPLGDARNLKTRNLHPRARPHRRNSAQPKSVLSPNSSSRISKTRKMKSVQRREKQAVCAGVPEPNTTKHAAREPEPTRRSTRLEKSHTNKVAQVPRTCILGPATASRVTKFNSMRSSTNGNIDQGRRACLDRNNNLRRSQRLMSRRLMNRAELP